MINDKYETRPNVTIKTVSTDEPNVSNRTITYDIYVDGIPAVGNIADVLDAIELKKQYEAN